MLSRIFNALNLRRLYKEAAVRIETMPQREPYALLPGFRSSPDYVTDVTSYLGQEAREKIQSRFPVDDYRAFLGLSSGIVGQDPNIPTVIAVSSDDLFGIGYLEPETGFQVVIEGTNFSSRTTWLDRALEALYHNRILSRTEADRIVQGFVDEAHRANAYDTLHIAAIRHAMPEDLLPKTFREDTYPGKYRRLINTVKKGPIQAELPLIA